MGKKKRARVIALYLPQYHPIPENDKFWGKGFTEWVNVVKAKPLFRGHIQPNIPADLGFYDLRLNEVQIEQANIAKEAGIEGFCYWHYWFGNGKEALEKPFDNVVRTGQPDFPFCLGWANHDWTTTTWEKRTTFQKDTMIFKQQYLGKDDHTRHFNRLLPAFKDKRYIKVDGKLLFVIFRPMALEDGREFMKVWNDLAKMNGIKGFHFVAITPSLVNINLNNLRDVDAEIENNVARYIDDGYDAVCTTGKKLAELKSVGAVRKIVNAIFRRLFSNIYIEKYNYKNIVKNMYTDIECRENVYPQLICGWDRTPRAGKKAIVYYNSTPAEFKKATEYVLKLVEKKDPEHRIVFLNSWNEWGEGAYMEPDLKFGTGKLDALREVIYEDD